MKIGEKVFDIKNRSFVRVVGQKKTCFGSYSVEDDGGFRRYAKRDELVTEKKILSHAQTKRVLGVVNTS